MLIKEAVISIKFTKWRKAMEDTRKKVTDVKQIDVYDSKYYLYDMTFNCTYDVYDVIRYFTDRREEYKSGGEKVDIEASNAVKEALGITNDKAINFELFGCTAFSAKSSEKNVYMGRNYDYATNTSCVLVRCSPHQTTMHVEKYKSIACAALSSLNMEKIDDENDNNLRLLPFVCLDGINEKGVSIAILVAGNKNEMYPTYQDADKSNIFTTLAVRLVLDCAATTQEAVELLKSFNMFANGCKDYHFFISDMTGDSRIIEFDYRDHERSFSAIKVNIATNFYFCDENGIKDEEPYTYFGHGHNRYIAVQRVIDNLSSSNIETTLWSALKRSSQEYIEGDPTSNTQWSILFNNMNQSAEIAIHRHFEEKERKTFYIK